MSCIKNHTKVSVVFHDAKYTLGKDIFAGAIIRTVGSARWCMAFRHKSNIYCIPLDGNGITHLVGPDQEYEVAKEANIAIKL